MSSLTFLSRRFYHTTMRLIRIEKSQIYWSIRRDPKYAPSVLQRREEPPSLIHNSPWDDQLKYFDGMISRNQQVSEEDVDQFLSCLSNQSFENMEIRHILQWMYFLSLFKTEDSQRDGANLAQKLLLRLTKFGSLDEKLDFREAVYLAHAICIMGLKVTVIQLVYDITKIFQQELLNDPHRVSNTNISTMRRFLYLQNLYSQEVMTMVDSSIRKDYNKDGFIGTAYALGFYSAFLTRPDFLPSWLSSLHQQVENLADKSSEELDKTFRSKDINRILWSLAFLNYRPEDAFLNTFSKIILKKLSNDMKEYPNHLVECLKSYVLFDYYPHDLFSTVLNDMKILQKLRDLNRTKASNNLYFVLESLSIDRPNLIELKHRALLYSIANPPDKNRFKDTHHRTLMKKICKNQKVVYPLNHFSNISIKMGGTIVEVIDPIFRIRNHEIDLNGIMNAKLRQMTRRGLKYLDVSSEEEFNQLNNE